MANQTISLNYKLKNTYNNYSMLVECVYLSEIYNIGIYIYIYLTINFIQIQYE